jgi:hypothetical protein
MYRSFVHLIEGDRKAYYEQSQITIKSNKDEVSKLKAQNKELRAALAKSKKVNLIDVPKEEHLTDISCVCG